MARPPLAVVVLLLLALVAGACTGGGDRRAEPPATSGESPRRGGTLRLAVVAPATLDPALARSADELLIADQLFDGLVAMEATSKAGEMAPAAMEVVPAVADRWQADPEQKVWEFHISPTARFSDGAAVTASDVKFTLDRIARRGSGSSVADLLEPVSGFRAASVEGTAAELAGVTVPSPDVVRIQLDQPLAVLPEVLANPAFGIVPRGAVEAASPSFAEQPVGSGPFAITARSAAVLETAAVSPERALVDGVDFLLFADRAGAYEAFTEGRADWADVPAEQVAAAAETYGRGGFAPYGAELFYGFNLNSPKFADPRFREAIVRAVDRQSIAGAVYGGTVRPTTALVMAGIPGHQADPCGERCAFDPDRARALLAEAFPDGGAPVVAIDFDDDRTQQAVAAAMQSSLQAVGISAELRPKPLTEYQSFAVSGQQELFRLGWVAPYVSPDAVLGPLFLSGSASNLTGFASPEVDGLLAAARAEPDAGARLSRYQEAERAVLAQLPVLPVAQFEVHGVVADRVRDLVISPLGTFDAAKVWLAPGDAATTDPAP